MTNLKYLKKVKKDDDGLSEIETSKYEFRKAKALEIIAEELINIKAVLLKKSEGPFIRRIS